MSKLRMITDYKDNEVYRLSFNELAKNVFKIEFENYYQMGFWNDRYICYSYLDGEKVVSNVSVNIIDLIVEGFVKKAMQLGTVMTDPEYRGRGLARNLIETIINKYQEEYDLFYLFANDSVQEFYPKFGFKKQEEYTYYSTVNIEQKNIRTLRKLNVDDRRDIELIRKMAKERKILSQLFATNNTDGILGWYCLNVFKDNIYLIKNSDAIVIYDVEDGIINLYDVISTKEMFFKQIINSIADVGFWKVVFHFTPGFIDNKPICEKADHRELFTRGGEFPKNVVHPITAHA